MIKEMGKGLLVTEVMGQGVNTVTGDYSRGASGFPNEDTIESFNSILNYSLAG